MTHDTFLALLSRMRDGELGLRVPPRGMVEMEERMTDEKTQFMGSAGSEQECSKSAGSDSIHGADGTQQLTTSELVKANAKYKAYAKRAAEPMPFYAWLQFWRWGKQGGACSFNDKAAAGRKGKAAHLAGMSARNEQE